MFNTTWKTRSVNERNLAKTRKPEWREDELKMSKMKMQESPKDRCGLPWVMTGCQA